MSDVMELLKRQEDLEAMIQAQSDRFIALQKKKTQVTLTTGKIRGSQTKSKAVKAYFFPKHWFYLSLLGTEILKMS